MKAAFYTLGCKVNQYETQALEKLFSENGFEIADFSDRADVYIINTCTVTALSDKKSRNAARRAKTKNPDCILAVCGCYAQVEPEEIKELCGADIVLGNGNKGDILKLVQEMLQNRAVESAPLSLKERLPFEHLPAGGLVGRTRALLKVQDGCQNFCAYCKIPYARGLSRSLPLKDAVADAIEIAQAGYKEIVITGIEISSYGFDLDDKPSLASLIKGVCNAVPNVRIRLGSLEPRTVDEDFIREVKDLDNLCPQFHLSMQSGCDKTLKNMNRKYSSERYYKSVELLREAFPGCAVTTDLIVGFPGETEEDFTESIDFVKKCAFAKVHIFPFSRRKGTRAYNMPMQVLKAEKEKRAARALEVTTASEKEFLRSKIGQTLCVLFEQKLDNGYVGFSKEYCHVFAVGDDLHNQVLNVRITDEKDGVLIGEII